MPELHGNRYKWELRAEMSSLYKEMRERRHEIRRLNWQNANLRDENLVLRKRLEDLGRQLGALADGLDEFREPGAEDKGRLRLIA
jgi:predicted  nucleic acid-binding Zn-ribbon protein